MEHQEVCQKGEYDYALVPEHPNRTKNGYVLAHRVVVENHLGRILDKSEIVHHLDGNKHNNDIHNLVVMSSKDHVSEHQRLHGRKYAVIKCPNCLKTMNIPENRLCCKKKGANYLFAQDIAADSSTTGRD